MPGLFSRKRKNQHSYKKAFGFNLTRHTSQPKTQLKFSSKGTPDKEMLIIFIVLTLFGIVMVYSASFISHSKFWFFTAYQIMWVVIGTTLGAIAYFMDYKFLTKLILPGFVVTIILLILVLIPEVGVEINGARRWLDIGPVNIQPSELVKLIFIIYLASWASKTKQHQIVKGTEGKIIQYLKHDLLPFGILLFLICGLVLLEPDLATAGIIGFTAIAVYFMAIKDKYQKYGAFMILGITITLGLIAGIVAPYRFERINTYVKFLSTGEVQDPYDDGYQLQNILIAVGSGGLFGVGFGESRQKFHYLGHTAFSDNIFAIIAEEFGFVGGIIIASVFLYLLLKGMQLTAKCDDNFARLLVSGITIWITLQAFFHIASNIGLIPVTGIPMPFLSYGGSSLVTILTASGIILNISRHAK